MTAVDKLLADLSASIVAIESYCYKLLTWSDFVNQANLPDGLLARAEEVTQNRFSDRQWVIYDPEGDYESWLLIGEKDRIVRETVLDLVSLEPPEGPLSPEALGLHRSVPPRADMITITLTKKESRLISNGLRFHKVNLENGIRRLRRDHSEKHEPYTASLQDGIDTANSILEKIGEV